MIRACGSQRRVMALGTQFFDLHDMFVQWVNLPQCKDKQLDYSQFLQALGRFQDIPEQEKVLLLLFSSLAVAIAVSVCCCCWALPPLLLPQLLLAPLLLPLRLLSMFLFLDHHAVIATLIACTLTHFPASCIFSFRRHSFAGRRTRNSCLTSGSTSAASSLARNPSWTSTRWVVVGLLVHLAERHARRLHAKFRLRGHACDAYECDGDATPRVLMLCFMNTRLMFALDADT